MRVATGNKGLAKHIAKVERAKTQLIIAMQEFDTYVIPPS